jgi:hypothetical protein
MGKLQDVVPIAGWKELASTESSTLATRVSSFVVPEMTTVPDTFEPLGGLTDKNVGGVWSRVAGSGWDTVTVVQADPTTALESVTSTVKVWKPLGSWSVLTGKDQGVIP